MQGQALQVPLTHQNAHSAETYSRNHRLLPKLDAGHRNMPVLDVN